MSRSGFAPFRAPARFTGLAVEYAELRDDPEAMVGVPFARFLSFLYEANPAHSLALRSAYAWQSASARDHFSVPASDAATLDLLRRASEALVPSLILERRAAQARDAGSEFAWPESVARLPERWHNLAVLLSEGHVPAHLAEVAATVLDWDRESNRSAERDALLAELRADAIRWTNRVAELSAGVAAGVPLAPIVDALRSAVARLEAAAVPSGAPAPVGAFLGPVGAEGSWDATVRAVRPFRSGGGCTIELAVPVPGRQMWAVVFAVGGACRQFSRGDEVRISGRIAGHGRAPTHGEQQTEFERGARLERR